MSDDNILLEASWKAQLLEQFHQPYMKDLKAFLRQRKQQGATIYPEGPHFFRAFELTPFDDVKVVILGQDPYHGPGQAHGLCFSVRPGTPAPPSLVNIYKEIHQDLRLDVPTHGFLESWAQQGVFLLNSVLTVEAGQAGAHRNKGWELFTDQAIETLASQREGIVFMLWGAYAHKKAALIDPRQHLILKAPHPSPLSAHRGFFGCRHFSQANTYLQAQGKTPINWALPDLTIS